MLPVELWQKILIFSTIIPGKEEFTTDSSSYITMPCDISDAFPPPTEEEQVVIFRTRLSIVKVCKYWYTIGMQLLWSHLHLNEATAKSVLITLEQEPQLGAFVQRVTTDGSLDLNSDEQTLTQIFNRLPNIRILRGPLMPLKLRWNCLADAIIHEYAKPDDSPRLACLWDHVHTLHIDLKMDKCHIVNFIILPQLENLSIVSHKGIMRYAIHQFWKLPSLHTLSINFPVSDLYPWMLYLKNGGNKIQKLQLVVQDPRYILVPDVQMPNLHTLYLDEKSAALTFLSSIDAPNLRRLGIFGIRYSTITSTLASKFLRNMNNALDKFKKIEELCLLVAPRFSLISLPDFTEEHLEEWRRRGISVTGSFIEKQ